MLIKATYPNAHLSILATLFNRFPSTAISQQPTNPLLLLEGSVLISSALISKDPRAYTGSFDDEKRNADWMAAVQVAEEKQCLQIVESLRA